MALPPPPALPDTVADCDAVLRVLARKRASIVASEQLESGALAAWREIAEYADAVLDRRLQLQSDLVGAPGQTGGPR